MQVYGNFFDESWIFPADSSKKSDLIRESVLAGQLLKRLLQNISCVFISCRKKTVYRQIVRQYAFQGAAVCLVLRRVKKNICLQPFSFRTVDVL